MSTGKTSARNIRVRTLKKSDREYFAIVGNDDLNPLFWAIFARLWEELNTGGGGEDLEMPTPMEDIWRGEKIICAKVPETIARRLIEMKREGGWQSFVIYRQARGELLKEWKPTKELLAKSKPRNDLSVTLAGLLVTGSLKRASDLLQKT